MDEDEYYDVSEEDWQDREPTCRFCGKRGLNWVRTVDNKWEMREDGGKKHVCVKIKLGKSIRDIPINK